MLSRLRACLDPGRIALAVIIAAVLWLLILPLVYAW